MATRTPSDTDDLGRISRVRGMVFENLTRAASLVGVVALAGLLVYITFDAVQPLTAEPAWYAILAVTFGLPSTLLGLYGWGHPAVGWVSIRSLGVTLGAVILATLLVVWLGGQLGLLALLAVVVPTCAYGAWVTRYRDALGLGLQTAGVAVAGATVATTGAIFLGAQATLVYAVAVGVPAALLVRYFLDRPAIGSVGAPAIAAGLIGLGITSILVEAAASVLAVQPGEAALGAYGLGAVLGVGAYALYARAYRHRGTIGLFAPFILLAGALAAYLFHREFVITAPVVPLLFAVMAGLPALAVAARTIRGSRRGHRGVLLPVVPLVGAVAAVAFHGRFVVQGPTVLGTYGLAIALGLGAYGWYVVAGGEETEGDQDGARRDRSGTAGLIAPAVVFGGLLVGLLGARYLGIAGPESWLDVQFILSSSHYEAALAGIHPTLIGSLYLMVIVAFVSFPVGVGAAIYLEEYAPDNRWTRLIEINIANLAGVPSVVYGLLGVGVFVRYGGLPLGAVVVGGFTLSLLILPIVIISAQEAIRAVPDSLRQASYGMGGTRWQTIRNVVLPRALPGILTGTILALGRAVGETAPLLMVGFAAIGSVPESLTGQGTAMPLQVFSWALDAQPLFRENLAAAGALTLLIVMLGMNGIAILIRNRYQGNS